jgi:hypothetical protein
MEFTSTHVSTYLKSLLDPRSGVASIPDDNVQKVHLRNEVSTDNILVGDSGEGLFVFYPNNPSSLVGVHYTREVGTGNLVFDRVITTAQALAESYNYSRLVSRDIKVISSTIPSGVYALNGTINAVRFEGAPSETPSLTYQSLLSATSNREDKVGNVLIGDGINILALPQGFNRTFVRLDDRVPSDLTTDAVALDGNHGIEYEFQGFKEGGVAGDARVFNFNIDATDLATVSGHVNFFLQPGSIPEPRAGTLQITINAKDLAGATIRNVQTRSDMQLFGYALNSNRCSSTFHFANALPRPSDFGYRPTAALEIQVVWNSEDNLATPAVENMEIVGTVNVYNGGYPGANRPCAIAAYQGVASESVITVTSNSNYELIPNSALVRNLPTVYSRSDPKELEYVKMILGNQDRLGLASIWPLKRYEIMLSNLRAYVDVDSPDEYMAFDWGNLLKQIKNVAKVALPPIAAAGSVLFPEFAPLIGGAAALAQPLLAASGRPIGLSATDKMLRPTPLPAIDWKSCVNGRSNYHAMDPLDAEISRGNPRPSYHAMDTVDPKSSPLADSDRRSYALDPKELQSCIIPFPAVSGSSTAKSKDRVFLAVEGDHSYILDGDGGPHRTCKTVDGFTIHGLAGERDYPATGTDVTVFPLESIIEGNPVAEVGHQAPDVNGSSAMGAVVGLIALNHEVRRNKGNYFMPMIAITGSTTRGANLNPPLMVAEKLMAAARAHMQLAANNDHADYPIRNVGEYVRLAQKEGSDRGTQRDITKLKLPQTRLLYLAASPEDFPRLPTAEELGEVDTTPFYLYDDPLSEPTPTVQAADLMNQAVSLMANARAIDPTLAATVDGVMWTLETGLAPILSQWARSDRSGSTMLAIINNRTQAPGRRAPVNLSRALPVQRERANAIYSKLQHQIPGISVEWILANGVRGPTTEQNAYISATKTLPEPGDLNPVIPQSSTGGKLRTKVENVIRSQGWQPGSRQAEALKNFADTNKRLPTTEEFSSVIPGYGASTSAQRKSARAKPNPPAWLRPMTY